MCIRDSYGIPLYYAHRSDILKSPVLTLLLGALDACLLYTSRCV